MDIYMITWIYIFGTLLHSATTQGDGSAGISSSPLYCKFEEEFYELFSTWSTQCHRYNCTEIGIHAEPRQVCAIRGIELESSRCPGAKLEPTDTASCCNEEYFCPSLPPHSGSDPVEIFGCPGGWLSHTIREGIGHICMMRFEERRTFLEAQEFCRASGSYLLNHENSVVQDFNIQTLERKSGNETHSTILEGESHWTGLFYDGNVFSWDVPNRAETPQLNVIQQSQCAGQENGRITDSVWSCDYDKQWADLSGDPCVAANITSYGYQSNVGDASIYHLANCDEKKPFICYGDFSESSFQLQTSILCEEGWLWSNLTRECFKYVDSKEASPNYIAAVDHCQSMDSELYRTNTRERQFLLYEIMNGRRIKAFSVWVGDEECLEITNPYIAGTPSLDATRRVINCYSQLPYICVKEEQELTTLGDNLRAVLDIDQNGNQNCTLLNGESAPNIFYSVNLITPELEIRNIPTVISVPQGGFRGDGGPYQCVISLQEMTQRIYSNVVNLDADGHQHNVIVTLPLMNHPFKGFYNMVRYYRQLRDQDWEPNILDIQSKPSAVIDKAFQLSKEYFLNSTLCPGCTNDKIGQSTRVYQKSVMDISKGALFLTRSLQNGAGCAVSVLLTFVAVSDSRTLYRLETNEWVLLESLMAEKIAVVLNLTDKERSLVSLAEAGQCSVREEYIATLNYTILLPTTAVGEQVTFSKCGLTGNPIVTAVCLDEGAGTRWNITVVDTCEGESDMTEKSRKLRDISLRGVRVGNIVAILNETAELSQGDLTVADVTYISEILSNVNGVLISEDTVDEYFGSALEIVNSVLNAPQDVITAAQNNAQSSDRIIRALERLALTTINGTSGRSNNIFEAVRPNMAYRLTMQPEISGVVSLDKSLSTGTIQYINSSIEDKVTLGSDKVVSLILHDHGITSMRKSFVVYGNNKLHMSSKSLKAVDRIVSVSVATQSGEEINLSNGFSNLVTIHYPNTVEDNEMVVIESALQCGFWSTDTNAWLTNGCLTTRTRDMGIICSCDHLTDFSVLLDINRADAKEDKRVDRINRQILSIISLVGLAVSVAALGLVVLTAILYRRLRKTNSQKVLVCLALSLLGLDITFLVGIERVETYAGCVTAAVLMHYFLLASFAWMLVEAILQYLRFVKVLGTYIPRFMLKATIPAFGIPLVIVAVVLAIDVNIYKASDTYCWMTTEGIYYAVLIPIGLVLIANTIVFGMVLHGLICARRRMKAHQASGSERETAILHINSGIAVFVVLGLTWIFGYLALFELSSLAFQYLFCIFNSIQGLLIFIFHNIREPAVRQEWLQLCKCCGGKEKSSCGSAQIGTNGTGNLYRSKDRKQNGIDSSDRDTALTYIRDSTPNSNTDLKMIVL